MFAERERNRRPGRAALLRFAILLGAALACYGPALGNGFYLDDAVFLNQARDILEDPARVWTARGMHFVRPVWNAFNAAEFAAFGLNPAGYFAAGILLLASTGFLVWLVARRVLPGEAAPLVAALAFVGSFAYSEATLWMCAQSSLLVVACTVLAVHFHLRAIEKGGWLGPALTALAVLAALFAKESGITVLVWIPLAEASCFGWRHCFTRRALARYAAIGVAAALYLLSHQWLLDTLLRPSEVDRSATRATGANITLGRVAGTFAWLFSPVLQTADDLRPWLGALLAAVAIATVLLARREAARAVLLGTGLAVTGLFQASSFSLPIPSSARHYALSGVGAALVVGSLFAVFWRSGPGSRRGPRLGSVGLCLIALYLGLHARSIHALNARLFRPDSRAQTGLARELGKVVRDERGSAVYLVEPPIENVAHLRHMLRLFHGLDPARVTSFHRPREAAARWLSHLAAAEPGAVALEWDEGKGLVPVRKIQPPRRRRYELASIEAATDASCARDVGIMRIACPRRR
jgi:hypothetical protein